jgi:hypothetical protein
MRKTTPIFFKVRGKGNFPIDMLRYDECFPSTPVDVSYIEDVSRVEGKRVEREVSLVTNKKYGPTEARWESFGWTVWWDHS